MSAACGGRSGRYHPGSPTRPSGVRAPHAGPRTGLAAAAGSTGGVTAPPAGGKEGCWAPTPAGAESAEDGEGVKERKSRSRPEVSLKVRNGEGVEASNNIVTSSTQRTFTGHVAQQQRDARSFKCTQSVCQDVLGHKPNLEKFKRTEITQSVLSDHKIKSDIRNEDIWEIPRRLGVQQHAYK